MSCLVTAVLEFTECFGSSPAFNQEKALVGAFSVLTNLRMELFQALVKDDLFIREDVVHKYELGRHQEL